MGCHTWFYTKIERTQEEAKELWINEHIKSINRWEEMCKNPNDNCRVSYNWSQEFCNLKLEVLKRQLRRVQNGGCKEAIWNKQPDKELTIFIKGKGLFIETSYHDIFRRYGYPEVKLFSYEETIDYIIDNKCYFYEDTLKQLIKFWAEYPNGVIEFG